MKKVIILSCNTGQGHNSCARAIQEYFASKNVSCEIYDALSFISKRFAKFISWGHSFMYRNFPGLFQWGYRFSKAHTALFHKDSRIYRLLTSGAERMYRHIVNGGYDTVICTHVFSAIIVTHLVGCHALSVNTAFVATDYTDYPGMGACDLERYFIADESLIDKYVRCGVPRQRIIPTGIPVSQKFFEKEEKAEAKNLLQIEKRNRHLLVMCGSIGCGPIKSILKHLVRGLPEQAEVTVICGTNRRLYRRLNRRYGKDGHVHIVGYTDQVSLYMDSADLYLTKPGGISVTEAAAKQLPMLYVNAVAGCEQYNMDFFTKRHSAVTAETPKLLAQKGIHLLLSEVDRQKMTNKLREYPQPNGAAQIYDKLLSLSTGEDADRIFHPPQHQKAPAITGESV